jgi:hypothetical protein
MWYAKFSLNEESDVQGNNEPFMIHGIFVNSVQMSVGGDINEQVMS